MERSQARLVAGEESHIVAEAAERVLADLADPQNINQANNGAWKEPLWSALSEAGRALARVARGCRCIVVRYHTPVLACRGCEPMIALVATKDCGLGAGRNLAGDASN